MSGRGENEGAEWESGGGMGVRGVHSWSIRVCAPGKLLLLCSALEGEPEQNQQDQHQQSMGERRRGEEEEEEIEDHH